jgi:hypothetical protein
MANLTASRVSLSGTRVERTQIPRLAGSGVLVQQPELDWDLSRTEFQHLFDEICSAVRSVQLLDGFLQDLGRGSGPDPA